MIRLLGAFSIKPNEIGLPEVPLEKGITGIINGLMQFAGALSVIFIIVGGILYVTSAGDPGRVKTARDTITYAVLGLILTILAYAIVTFVTGRLG